MILKMVAPYIVNGNITFNQFENVFDMLSLHEKYSVVDLLIANNIGLEDENEVVSNAKNGSGVDGSIAIEEKKDNNFLIKYDKGIFTDSGKEEEFERVIQYENIKQSNIALCELIQNGSLQARNDICVKNSGLIYKYAQAYQYFYGNNLDIEDLVQAGHIGLAKAAEKFDIGRNSAFSTYATFWIKQAISREIVDKGFIIRLPVHVFEKISKVSRLDSRYDQEGYTYRERLTLIASELNCTESKVSELLSIRSQFLSLASLNVPVGEENETEFGDLIEDVESISPEDEFCKKELRDIIEKMLDDLTPKEKKVLRLRFGFDNGRSYTLEEVGKEFGVTRERIRQIEAKAIRKLRQPMKRKKLNDYY